MLGSVAKFDGMMILRFSDPLICCTVILFYGFALFAAPLLGDTLIEPGYEALIIIDCLSEDFYRFALIIA